MLCNWVPSPLQLSTIPTQYYRHEQRKGADIYAINQKTPTPIVTHFRHGPGIFSLGYAKQTKARIGEDYLCIALSPEKIDYALSDGVSQSFGAHIAAKYAADLALDALLTGQDVRTALQKIPANDMRSQLENYGAEFLKNWLEQSSGNNESIMYKAGLQKVKTSSMCVMSCGTINLISREHNNYSFGDITTIVQHADSWQKLPNQPAARHQWASDKGISQETILARTGKIHSIAIFSDGIEHTSYDPVEIPTIEMVQQGCGMNNIEGDDCSLIRYVFD